MKKLTSILALTAVVANLGIATAFAQVSGTPRGSQTIGCNSAGASISIQTPTTATFQGRATNFFNDTTDAPLTSNLTVDVNDPRGYDPGPLDCSNESRSTDTPWTVQIQSDGLRIGVTGTILALKLGSAHSVADLTDHTTLPAVLSPLLTNIGDVVTGVYGANQMIDTAKNLISFDETFYGEIRLSLTGDDLQVVRPSAVIPGGLYQGAILLTVNP